MDRVRRGTWKLTFVAWSSLLVIWAVVTAAMDFDTLAVARWIARQRSDWAIAAIALLVALPLIVDAGRNVHRTYRLYKRRSRQERGGTQWSQQVPTVTPRRFRGEGLADLTRRERMILEQGQIGTGLVTHHGELTSVRFETPWGRTIASRPVEARGERPREGAAAPLLFEPGARMGVAPSLHGLEFVSPKAEDRRESGDAIAPRAEPTRVAPAGWEAAVHASLHPVERASGTASTEVGRLAFDGDKLTLTLERAEPVSLRLDRPFRVTLSCWLLPDGMAELDVALEPQTQSAYRAGDEKPLRFKTEISQARLASHLDQARHDDALIAPDDFEAIWGRIVTMSEDDRLASIVRPA
jgi:hypothetical protein